MEPTRQIDLFEEITFQFPIPVRRAFRRRRQTRPSEWARTHIFLPNDVTSHSGYWRPDLTPYSPTIMDIWADPWVRKIVFAAGPQTGKTLTAYLPHLYALDRAPGPMFAAMAAQDGAKKMSLDYFQPIIRASPKLRRHLTRNPDDLAAYRLKFRNGMRIYAAWVSSPLLLKSFPARYGLGDEVDDWCQQAGYEDDPEGLFEIRLRTYPHTSKLILVSTPSDYDRGIWPKLKACQLVQTWMVPCPICERPQRLTWPPKGSPFYPRVTWPGGAEANPTTIQSEQSARYICAECGAQWDDRTRHAAIGRGSFHPISHRYLSPEADGWYDPFPEPPSHIPKRPVSVGFHVPAIASKLIYLGQAARAFLEANNDPNPIERKKKVKTWRNSYPAIPWTEELPIARTERELRELCDDRPAQLVPDGALLLVLTADVQDPGIYFELRAWGLHRTSWLIHYGFLTRGLDLPISPGELPIGFPRSADFIALRAIYDATYMEADSTEHQPWICLVDSRWRSVEVYDFCRTISGSHPVVGYESLRALPVQMVRKNTYPGTKRLMPNEVYRVDVDINRIKDALANHLQVSPGTPGSWNLHSETGSDYFQHYRSESKDETKGIWIQRGAQPNHWWDCGVYQLAAVYLLEGQKVFQRLAQRSPEPSQQIPTTVHRSASKRPAIW